MPKAARIQDTITHGSLGDEITDELIDWAQEEAIEKSLEKVAREAAKVGKTIAKSAETGVKTIKKLNIPSLIADVAGILLDGAINEGCSENVFINGRKAARKGSEGSCYSSIFLLPLPHSMDPRGVYIEDGSKSVYINGLPAVRIGDPVRCGAQVGTGSDTVFFG